MPNFKPELNALDPQPIGLGAVIRKPVEIYARPKEISPGIYQDSDGKLKTFFSENEKANLPYVTASAMTAPAVKRVRRPAATAAPVTPAAPASSVAPAAPVTSTTLLEGGTGFGSSIRKPREFQKASKTKSLKSHILRGLGPAYQEGGGSIERP